MTATTSPGKVAAVHRSSNHSFSKVTVPEIDLIAGLGVDGDAHQGAQVKHRSRVAADPTQPNLRQVHLIHRELFDDMANQGFAVGAGDLGENITTQGIRLLDLPSGTTLQVGAEALVAITGLRNPCQQINNFQPGLLDSVLKRDKQGALARLAGVMGVVVRGGAVKPGDSIEVSLPPPPHHILEPV